MSEEQPTKAYVWFDSEFTSLEMEQCHLLQVSMIITDHQLNRLTSVEDDVCVYVKLPDDVTVSPWVMEHIPDIVASARSEEAVAVADVEQLLVNTIEQCVGKTAEKINERPVIAGNSIHADMQVIRKWLPKFEACLNYRMLDVSAWKLGWLDHFGQEAFDKENQELLAEYLPTMKVIGGKAHDAYFDVCASLAEYRFYLDKLTLRRKGD